jgi:isoprenylcysteine carboxyl methyltransferase (ICMT) family protein YpbQ
LPGFTSVIRTRAELPEFFVVSELVAVPVVSVFWVGAVIQVVALVLSVPVRQEWQGWGRGALR